MASAYNVSSIDEVFSDFSTRDEALLASMNEQGGRWLKSVG